MKKYILFFALFGTISIGSVSVAAQCDPNVESPIKCSYYNEGYQDGGKDALRNLASDYRRYRSKYERRYENLFRDGYQAGYEAANPSTRWTISQRSAYDSGYRLGQIDRRRANQSQSSESRGSQYDQNIGLYFQQGYSDGFDDRQRQYDVPVTSVPPPGGGGGGTASGNATWGGRVDDRANIIIRGNAIYAENVSGNGTQTNSQNMNGVLPRRPTTISARKSGGRGTILIIQQPMRSNDFTGIVQVYDPKGGSENYRIDISWVSSAPVDEPYRPGSVSWRGRVDQTVQIKIAGSEVQSEDISTTGLTNVNFSMNGSLPNRPVTVNVRKRSGRGTVTVVEQPSRFNDFTATIQIFDPNGGADNYQLEISW